MNHRHQTEKDAFLGLADELPLIVSLASPAGELEYVSARWTAFSGQSADDFLNGEWVDAIHPDDRERIVAAGEEAVATGEPYEYEFRARAADGEYRWLLARGTPIRGGDGKIARWVSTAVDIHDVHEASRGYDALFASIEQGFCTIDVVFDDDDRPFDYRFVEVSPSFTEQTGIDNAPGRTMLEIAPDMEERFFEIYGRIALTGEPARFEDYSVPLGRWWNVHAFRIEERPRGRVGVLFDDITARKQAEEALRFREEQFGTLLDRAPLGVYLVDADFRIREVNPVALPVFGDAGGSEGVIGRDFDEIIHALWEQDYADEVVGIFRHTLETGESYVTPERAQERIDLGTTEYYEWRVDRISLPDGSNGVVCYFRDISEQVGARETIRASEERLRLALDVADMGSFVWYPAPDEAEADERFFSLFGLTPDDTMTAEATLAMIHPEDLPAYADAVAAALDPAGDGELREEYRVRHPDGTERWLSVSGRTYFDGDAAVRMTGTGVDITERKLAESALEIAARGDRFRLVLSDALRPLERPLEVYREAARVLGEELGASRAFFTEIDAHDHYLVDVQFVKGVSQVPAGRYPVSSYGHPLLARYVSGLPVVVNDTSTTELLDEPSRDAVQTLDVHAFCGIPLMRSERVVAILVVHQHTPREWTPEEVALMRETGERGLAAYERAGADVARQASEEKYRALFDSLDQAVTTVDLILDEEGRCVDFRYVESNPAAASVTGLPSDVDGRLASEAVGEIEPRWLDLYGRVAATGAPERLEYPVAALDRWFEVFASRVGGEGSRRIVVVYQDTTERKQAEARRRLLLELADALRPLTDPAEIQRTAMRTVAEHLGLPSAVYFDVDTDGEHAEVREGYKSEHIAFPARVRLADFGSFVPGGFLEGRTIFYEDFETDPRFEAQREAFRALGNRAGVGVPIFRDGRLVAALAVNDTQPRRWTDPELRLLEEVAERTWSVLERARAEDTVRESESLQAYLLRLSDALRSLADPQEIQAAGLRVLGEHLQVDRAFYASIDEERDEYRIEVDYTKNVPPLVGAFRLSEIRRTAELAGSGQIVVVEDATVDPRLSEAERATYAAMDTVAAIGVPLMEGGRLVVSVGVHRATARVWTPHEIAVVRETAERLWPAVERARAEIRVTTERERRERLEREFVANAAHELRTPLTAILGAIETLQSGAKNVPEDRDLFLDHLERESARMQRLSESLLLLAQADSAAGLPQKRVAVMSLLEEMASELRVSEGVEVEVHAPETLEVVTHRGLAERVIVNLAENAAKYTRAGRIVLSAQSDGSHVVFTVSDTGSGIPPGSADRAFDRFFRAGDRSSDGFGLGLSIARQSAAAIGGSVELSAAPGGGTVARLVLPAAEET